MFPLDPQDLFHERREQFVGRGIPGRIVALIEQRISDCWREGPGGWVHEWSAEARAAQAQGQWLLAAALHGAAHFPVACTPARQQAMRCEVDCFMRASHRFPVHFERVMVRVTNEEGRPFPVHVYTPRRGRRYPLVCLTGGTDTGKMALHRMALALSLLGGFQVAAMDMPGTGETGVGLRPDSDVVYRSVLAQLGEAGRKKAIVGISFGGHWAAKLALLGQVDAAIDIGGPVWAADVDPDHALHLPHGMSHIVANAAGLDALPGAEAMRALIGAFSLKHQGLLALPDCAPLLVINGNRDPYIPEEDALVFGRYSAADIWLFDGLGHCAAQAIPRAAPAMVAWLRHVLHGGSVADRLALGLAKMVLPARAAMPPATRWRT